MKFSGQSWNRKQSSSKGVQSKYPCKHCGRRYKMDWALNNHMKLCKEHYK